ncbi:MAG TPA: hypothetical protein PK472_07665 [Pseudomonadota bacterium]|nr:hypothetical protein [Pseudomonadota bacterium]HNI60345.1 hypothetical protein [Pseudomonadota bacterium]HNN53070.1 hypothetical protein [Pseudomonadota bacterium]
MKAGAGPLRLAIVCEARRDFDLASTLIDRVLLEKLAWLDGLDLSLFRCWQGFRGPEPFLRWDKVHEVARSEGLRVAGRFGGEPGAMDAAAARKALLLFATRPVGELPHAVVLIRDTDGHIERCKGLQQARTEPNRIWPFPVLIGAQHCKLESWLLAGFQPSSGAESQQLALLRQQLGFHPCEQSEWLASSDDAVSSKRSAKKVLSLLSVGDLERENRGFLETPLSVLRGRGSGCGLTNFLDYAEKRIVSLLRSRVA